MAPGDRSLEYQLFVVASDIVETTYGKVMNNLKFHCGTTAAVQSCYQITVLAIELDQYCISCTLADSGYPLALFDMFHAQAIWMGKV